MDLAWFNHGFTIHISFPHNQIVNDIIATTLTTLVALSCLRFWDEMAKRDVFDQVFCCNCFSFLTKSMSCFFSFYCSFYFAVIVSLFSPNQCLVFFFILLFLCVYGKQTCDPSVRRDFQRTEQTVLSDFQRTRQFTKLLIVFILYRSLHGK